MPRIIVSLLAIGAAVWVPIAVAWGQVPSVGPTRDVGVSCLCPGQPIRNYPAGTNCAAICLPTLPPAPAVSTSARRAIAAAEVPSAAETVMQTMLPMLQGLIQQIDQDQARRAAFAAEQGRIAQERWLEAQRRQQEIMRQEALERRRQQVVVHKALLSQLSFLDAQGGIGDRDLLSLSDPSAPGLQGLDDGLRPAGTSFFGLGGDAGSRVGLAEPAPEAPPVALRDLRRAAFLAEKAQDATPEQAATLVDEALRIADGAAPFVEIDDRAVPVVGEDGLRAFQEANIAYRLARDRAAVAVARVAEADYYVQLSEAVLVRTDQQTTAAGGTPRGGLAGTARDAVRRATEARAIAGDEADRARLDVTGAEAKRKSVLRSIVSTAKDAESEAASPVDAILVGGTGWIYGYNVPPGRDDLRAEARRNLEDLMKLKGLTREQILGFLDPTEYNVIIGMAASHGEARDLVERVGIGDEFRLGQTTAEGQPLYASLRGRQTERLDCHSNGAMVCLAALTNGDVQAERVRLFGPQITPAAIESWQKLIERGRIKTIEINIVRGDPIAPASYTFAELTDFLKMPIAPLPAQGLFSTDALKALILRKAPAVRVNLFDDPGCRHSMVADRSPFACHDMALYQRLTSGR